MTSSSEPNSDLSLIDVFLAKLNLYETFELCAQHASHYMLSTNDFKVPIEPPVGIISSMLPITGNTIILLLPVLENFEEEPLDLRLVHQLVRELTFGIYGLNAIPACSLDANYDQSTQCQLPPAYIDSKVGQLMIQVDYIMKSLWHGAYMPMDKRKAFTDIWRSSLLVNSSGISETKKDITGEFLSAGLSDITKDPEYAKVYDKMKLTENEDKEEMKFFMSHVDEMAMIMTLFQRSINQYKNIFLIDADWLATSTIRATDEQVDKNAYERLHNKLQIHELIINDQLNKKKETAFNLHMLKLISFLTPLLVGLKKRMKIPNIKKLLSNLKGDECRTERELPPLVLSPDFQCKHFSYPPNEYFHLHGAIQIDHETPPIKNLNDASFVKLYDKILDTGKKNLQNWLDPQTKIPSDNIFRTAKMEIDGKSYFTICIELETYYHQNPQKPSWVFAMTERIGHLRLKSMNEHDIHDVYRKFAGTKKAITFKNQLLGLATAAKRGLVATFNTLSKKCPPSRLGKQDENGLSLLHHAAMNNRQHVIAQLILHSMDVNVRKSNNVQIAVFVPSSQRTGPTPLHLAARSGSFETAACLVANYANLLATDQDGWAPGHYAAFYDHMLILKLFINKESALLEFQTKDDIRSTPLLLASSSGALKCVKCLLQLGAYIQRKDDLGNNVIEVAALRFHTNILEFFIEWNHPEIAVWQILIDMLKSDDLSRKESAVKCIEILAISKANNWKEILKVDGIPCILSLLYLNDKKIQAVAASVLCSISEHDLIRKALCKADAGTIFIKLLSSDNDDIEARASIVLADMACVDGQQESLLRQGAMIPLIDLLESDVEDVLVYAVNAVRMMCLGCVENQTESTKYNLIEPLVEFLTIHSEKLQAAASSAIAAISHNHKFNQDKLINEGVVTPLIKLVNGHQVSAQVQAAAALESLCTNNSRAQLAFMKEGASKAVLKLFKYWAVEVREQGACALWAMAGNLKKQQKEIAYSITLHRLIEMLLSTSESLQYVGCMAMNALGYEDMEEQNNIVKNDGIGPLVRLLRSPKTSERVLLIVVQLLGTLCLGVAHTNNKVSQKKICEENAILHLTKLFSSPPNDTVKVEIASTLASIVLGNRANQVLLKEEASFKLSSILYMVNNNDERSNIRLKAGFALALFAFNNTSQQYAIKEAGGIDFDYFDFFLRKGTDLDRCRIAFQMVVLCRIVNDADQVTLTAQGISVLVDVLKCSHTFTVCQAASLIASVSHTRTGIPDALITLGAMDILISKLNREEEESYADDERLRFMCATALGYLSFNRSASRILLTNCRNIKGLYEEIVECLGGGKICEEFLEEFHRCRVVGMPCLSLEKYGGPKVMHGKHETKAQRPLTTQTQSRSPAVHNRFASRIKSAPPRTRNTHTPNSIFKVK